MVEKPLPRYRWRVATLALLALAPLAALMLLHDGPVLQDPGYHRFADTRSGLGISNFGNIASNAPFLLIGAAGLLWCLDHPHCGARRSWLVFFAGVALVFLGSAYYHAAPGDGTLVWDRLPMAIAFMALFAALLDEHLRETPETAVLLPAVLAGAASVFWWRWSGDLRIYIWVQLAPLLVIPYLVAAFPGRHTHRHYLLCGAGLYVCAKAAEFHDHEIHALTSALISGHTLKHLLAAAAAGCVLLMLRRRRRRFRA